MTESFIDSVVRASIHSSHVFTKAQFDNAKDTTELLAAAQAVDAALMAAVNYRLATRVDQMLIDRLDLLLAGQNKAVIKIGDKLYQIREATT